MKTKVAVVGIGEVGAALSMVLRDHNEVHTYDLTDTQSWAQLGMYDFVHICFPYTNTFIDACRNWLRYTKTAIVIHSTVPVGTTSKVSSRAVHSPVHGVHPNLHIGLRTFTKYVGGDTPAAYEVLKHLQKSGMPAMLVTSAEASELSKLCCTLQYGLQIMICREIDKLCKEHHVSTQEVYGWNREYNEGYQKLGMSEVCRPVLQPMPGKIGGHCVIPNAKLLPSWLSDLLLNWNTQRSEL